MKHFTVVAAATLLLGACTTDPFTGESKVSNTAIGAGTGAAVGSVAGAIVGKGKKGSRKAALIGAGIGALVGGGVGAYMDNQERVMRDRLRNSGVSVTRVGDNIILNMPGNVTFDTGRSDIRPQFTETLSSVALVLNEFNKSLVDVIGHTDSQGSDTYNQQLSLDRANSVSGFLQSRNVDGRRLITQGDGERFPIASNASAAGRAANRRVEIRIVPLTQG